MYRTNYYLFLIWPLILLLTGCVTVNSNEPQLIKASKINVQLGIGYYNRGNHELANEKLMKAIKQDPDSSQAYHALAVLQNHFLAKQKAEQYFRKSISLDDQNSEALNNFGAFLCVDKRYKEANKIFLQAIDNPFYRSPQVAYTSAAACLLNQGESKLERDKAKEYLTKALAVSANYRPALISLASISFTEKDYNLTNLYLERFHLTGNASARSLWLSIQNEQEMGDKSKVALLAEQLRANFPDSNEYKQWLALDL